MAAVLQGSRFSRIAALPAAPRGRSAARLLGEPAPARVFGPEETARLMKSLGAHGCTGHWVKDGAASGEVRLEARADGGVELVAGEGSSGDVHIVGRNAVYAISGVTRAPGTGGLVVAEDAFITQKRYRKHRRAKALSALRLEAAVGELATAPVLDLGFGGVGLAAAALAGSGLSRGDTVELAISYEDAGALEEGAARKRIALRGRVANVGPRVAGLAIEAESGEDARAWRALVSAHLYRHTRVGRAWTEHVFRVLEEVYLARWTPAGEGHQEWLARTAKDFLEASEITDALGAGHNVVFHDARGGLGTIAFASLFEGTWSGHQIGVVGALLGRGTTAKRFEVLREVYAHGFELTELDARAKRIAGYCTARHQWLLDTHFDFTRRLDAEEGYSLPLRMFHVDLEEGAPAASSAFHIEQTTDAEAMIPLFEALRADGVCPRPRLYRDALALTHDAWSAHAARIAGDAAAEQLGVRRMALLAYAQDGAEPIACAVLDSARDGMNVLGVFDIAHVYPLVELDPAAREQVFAALLAQAAEWFRSLGKVAFQYAQEQPERLLSADPWSLPSEIPPHARALESHGAALRDLGLGFHWIISQDRMQDFLEHVFLETGTAA